VPEDVPLYDWMRVREFLEFMAGIKRVPPPVRPALDDVVERIALGGVTELTIGKLSRGYRQRVAIAQALLNAPAVLILDEPTNGLDPRQIIEMRRLIRSLAGRHTVLVSSHVLGEIEKVADRAAILLGGRLLAIHALGERGAGHRLRVRVRGAAAVVCACLEGVTGVNRLTLEGEPADGIVTGVVEVDGAAVAEAVAAAVSAHGLGLAEVTEHRADLESVFLALTAGGPTTM
jgi:ABC-2 type transport system ATP-binding protein